MERTRKWERRLLEDWKVKRKGGVNGVRGEPGFMVSTSLEFENVLY